jgi:EmrB/QacA subfamily drug resistance transporter
MTNALQPHHVDAHEAVVDAARVRSPRGVLLATMLASSLAFVDGSVVNVGLHAIGVTFKADAGALQWIINAYLLPLSALLLLGGAAGDRFGRARLLVAGTTLFGLSSLACALAPSAGWLLAARAAQGTGAALLMPNSLAILGANFNGEARGRVIGIWAASGAAMAAIGPVLGGWLIDTVGWRWIFLINLPLATAAVVSTLFYVDEPPREINAPALDVLGGVLATAGLLVATWGLTIASGPEGWTAAAIILAAACIPLMLSFVFVERARGDVAMMPLSLFSSKSFVGLTLLTFLLYGALGVLLVLLPFILINAAGYTGTEAGTSLLPFAVVLALTSPLMGRFAARIGPRIPLTIGPFTVAAGFLLLLRIGPAPNYFTDILPGILVMSLGMAGAVAPLTTAVLGSVDARYTGAASGFNSAIARTGGLLGTALLGGVLSATGGDLIARSHEAWLACALTCFAAAAASFALVQTLKDDPDDRRSQSAPPSSGFR